MKYFTALFVLFAMLALIWAQAPQKPHEGDDIAELLVHFPSLASLYPSLLDGHPEDVSVHASLDHLEEPVDHHDVVVVDPLDHHDVVEVDPLDHHTDAHLDHPDVALLDYLGYLPY